jgi:hypothetical protein
MAELLDLLAVYYLAKRYAKRTYGAAYNRYDDGLEQMQRVRDSHTRSKCLPPLPDRTEWWRGTSPLHTFHA